MFCFKSLATDENILCADKEQHMGKSSCRSPLYANAERVVSPYISDFVLQIQLLTSEFHLHFFDGKNVVMVVIICLFWFLLFAFEFLNLRFSLWLALNFIYRRAYIMFFFVFNFVVRLYERWEITQHCTKHISSLLQRNLSVLSNVCISKKIMRKKFHDEQLCGKQMAK